MTASRSCGESFSLQSSCHKKVKSRGKNKNQSKHRKREERGQ